MAKEEIHLNESILSRPITGSILAISSGLSFFFLCMILPLVGPSGSKVDHALKNKAAFLAVLVITFLLAAGASYSKLMRRRVEGGPLPHYSLGLCGVCILTLLVLLVNGFAI